MSTTSSPCDYGAVQPQHLQPLAQALPQLLSGDWSLEALHAARISNNQLRVLTSSATGDIIGFAEYLAVVDECQLYNIAVLHHWQQQGYGSVLLQSLLAEAKTRGLTQCVLEVRESNAAARRLYQKFGFVEVGKRKDYYPSTLVYGEREAAVLYSLQIE